jgi:hypothetical protein
VLLTGACDPLPGIDGGAMKPTSGSVAGGHTCIGLSTKGAR